MSTVASTDPSTLIATIQSSSDSKVKEDSAYGLIKGVRYGLYTDAEPIKNIFEIFEKAELSNALKRQLITAASFKQLLKSTGDVGYFYLKLREFAERTDLLNRLARQLPVSPEPLNVDKGTGIVKESRKDRPLGRA